MTSILTGFMQDNRIIRPSRYPVCLPMNHLPEQKTIGSSSGDVKLDRPYQNPATTILFIPIARAALGYMTNVQGRSNSFMLGQPIYTAITPKTSPIALSE